MSEVFYDSVCLLSNRNIFSETGNVFPPRGIVSNVAMRFPRSKFRMTDFTRQ